MQIHTQPRVLRVAPIFFLNLSTHLLIMSHSLWAMINDLSFLLVFLLKLLISLVFGPRLRWSRKSDSLVALTFPPWRSEWEWETWNPSEIRNETIEETLILRHLAFKVLMSPVIVYGYFLESPNSLLLINKHTGKQQNSYSYMNTHICTWDPKPSKILSSIQTNKFLTLAWLWSKLY